MSQIVIIGQFDLHADDVPVAAQLMQAMMNETVKEPGCHHYAFSRDLDKPFRFQLSELWEDSSALDSHFATDHMVTFRAGMSKLRVEKRTVTRYEANDAKVL